MADSPTNASSASLRRLRARVAAGAFGGLLALVGVLFFLRSPPAPPLTPARFDAARDAWKSARPSNYDIEIEVEGAQPAVYAVRVRGGIARSATRNGAPLKQDRTFGTWSVDGMFDTIASDVEHLRRFEDGSATHASLQVDLTAEFDSHWNYPKRYRRIEKVRFGANRLANWTVTRFEIIAAETSTTEQDDDEVGS